MTPTFLERKLKEALAMDDNASVAEVTKDGGLDVIVSVPRWVVIGYLLYKVGKTDIKGLPPKSVKLARFLAEM